MLSPSAETRTTAERGTVLLTVSIVVFLIAAASAVTMKLAMTNLRQNEQSRKELQSHHVAESAINVGVSRLNQQLLDARELGELGNTSEVLLTESSGDVPFGSLRVPEGGNMVANKATDGFDNDGDGQVDEPDEPDTTYTGGRYRIRIREWSDDNGIDDDRDGEVDEVDESPARATSESANYVIEKGTDYINPKHPFAMEVEVLGAVPDTPNPDSNLAGEYHAPVTAQVVVKGGGYDKTFEPWGPYDDPNAGNIHSHGEKEIRWEPDKTFPEGAKVTFNFRSWKRNDYQWTVENPDDAEPTEDNVDWEYDILREEAGDEDPSAEDPTTDNSNLDPARDSDPVPGYDGAGNQEDPADFMGKYISKADDGQGKELNLPSNNAIFMGELTHNAKMETNDDGEDVCVNCDEVSGVDFQDIVLDVDIAPKTEYEEVGHGAVKVSGRGAQHKRRFTLNVTGTYGGYTTSLGTVVTATPESKAKYGLFATNDVTLKPNVLVDSYNSNQKSSYLAQQTENQATATGVSYARTHGNVGANGSVRIEPGTAVMGRVDHGTGMHQKPNSYVHHVEKSGELDESRAFEPAEVPDKPTKSVSSLTISGTKQIAEDSVTFPDVTLKKDAVLTVPPRRFIHIADSLRAGPDSTLVVKGPTKVRIDEDLTARPDVEIIAVTEKGPVEFYIGGDVKLQPGTSVYSTNQNGKTSGPATVRTENFRWFIGNSVSDGSVTMKSAGTDTVKFQGILYGPSADMLFFPNTQLYGTVIGENITARSGTGIHYDEALNKFCILLWDDCSYKAQVDTTWIKSTSGSAGP